MCKVTLKSEFLLAFCFCLFLSGQIIASSDPNLTASNSKHQIKVNGYEKNRGRNIAATLEVIKDGNNKKLVKIGGARTRVRSIKKLTITPGNKLVVHGKLKRADVLYMVDLETGEVIDFFWCYNPVLSPSMRYIVYEKFFPPHGLKEAMTMVVLIYDLEKKPEENRVPIVGYSDWPKSQVGIPVYPNMYFESKAYVMPDIQKLYPFFYTKQSPFLWSKNSKSIYFLCSSLEKQYLVNLDIGSGVNATNAKENEFILREDCFLNKYSKKSIEHILNTWKPASFEVKELYLDQSDPNYIIINPSNKDFLRKFKQQIPK